MIHFAGRMSTKWAAGVSQPQNFSQWSTGWTAPRSGSAFEHLYPGYPETQVNEGLPLGLAYDGRPISVFLLDTFGNNFHGTTDQRRATSHEGVDFTYIWSWVSRHDVPVRAIEGGVARVAIFFGAGGRHVSVEHDDGTIAYYGHIREAIVVDGQRVSRGQPIAHLDGGGAQHLHLGLEFEGVWIDPLAYLDPPMTPADEAIITAHYDRGDVGGNYAQTPWSRAHQTLPPIPDAPPAPPLADPPPEPDPVEPTPGEDPRVAMAHALFGQIGIMADAGERGTT